MEELSIKERVLRCRNVCVTDDPTTGQKRYLIVPNFNGTGFEKQGAGIDCPIFRSFEAIKPQSSRVMRGPGFDMYTNTLFDYPNIIASRMHKPWQNFNFMTSVHVAACPLDCWYCYVDECLRLECSDCRFRESEACKGLRSRVRKSMLTSQEIFDAFLLERRVKGPRKNVLRVTGGEPFLVPELIKELLKLIHDYGLSDDVFLWTETNLMPFIKDNEGRRPIDEYAEFSIDELLEYENRWALHPCFHGCSSENFKHQTGVSGNIDDLVEALAFLVRKGVDVYPSVSSNLCPNGQLADLFNKLADVNVNLPLRVALIETDLRYQPIQDRFDLDVNMRGRVYDKWSNIWDWDQGCFFKCGRHYAEVFREKAPLTGDLLLDGEPPLPRREEVETKVEPGDFVYLFKSCYRPLYRQELLSLLALPNGVNMQLEYRDELLHDSVSNLLSGDRVKTWSGNKHGVIIYMERDNNELTRFVPLRHIEMFHALSESGVTTLRFNTGEYVQSNPGFGEFLQSSVGESNLPDASQMNQKWVFQSADAVDLLDAAEFGQVVVNLVGEDGNSCCEDWRESCFIQIGAPEEIYIERRWKLFKEKYRPVVPKPVLLTGEYEENGFCLVNKRSYAIPVILLNPQYQVDATDDDPIVVSSSSDKIVVFGDKDIKCAKYRRTNFKFSIENVLWRKELGYVRIHSSNDSTNIPSIEIKTRLALNWVQFAFFFFLAILGLCLIIGPNLIAQVSQIWRVVSSVIGLIFISIAFFGYTEHWIGP